PAALAVFGRALFWPYGVVAAGHPQIAGAGWRGRLSRMLTSRPVAFLIAVLILAGLGVAAYGLRSARLGSTLIRDLPPDTQERQADAAASRGFADGILSPTEILLEGTGLDGHQAALARLEELVGRQRGVAAVLGPREEATGRALLASAGQKANLPDAGITVSKDGRAARLVVVMANDPL